MKSVETAHWPGGRGEKTGVRGRSADLKRIASFLRVPRKFAAPSLKIF
jgi:hypothetical protein